MAVHMSLFLTAAITVVCGQAFHVSVPAPVPMDPLEGLPAGLQDALEQLRSMDDKAFAVVSGALMHSQHGTSQEAKKFKSFLQFLNADSPTDSGSDSDRKLEALQPILEKLKKLDPKAFGALSASLTKPSNSFLQLPEKGQSTSQQKMEALQPVLQKLKGLDSKTFSLLSHLLSQSGAESFLQLFSDDDPTVASKLEALQPVLAKLRNLDPKTFGMLSKLLAAQDQHHSFLQLKGSPDSDSDSESKSKIAALAPVLSKLKGLDPKTFGLLKGLLAKAGSAEGQSLLQIASGSNPDAAERLQALQPVLAKLQKLDGKTFGMLSKMLAQAQAAQSES